MKGRKNVGVLNNRIDPMFGLPVSRPTPQIKAKIYDLLEFVDQIRGRKFFKSAHAEGIELYVPGVNILEAIPDSLARKVAALYIFSSTEQEEIDCKILGRFKSIKELRMGYLINVRNLLALSHHKFLQVLDIESCIVENIDLGEISNLKELRLHGSSKVDITKSLQNGLKAISVHSGTAILKQINATNDLDWLNVSNIRLLTEGDALPLFECVKVVHLVAVKNIKDLQFISSAKKLTHLYIENCRKLSSLKGLEHCEELKALDVVCCYQLKDINQIEKLNYLRDVSFLECPKIEKPVSSDVK